MKENTEYTAEMLNRSFFVKMISLLLAVVMVAGILPISAFAEGYKAFLAKAKTEREAVKASIEIAERAGFKPFDADKKYVAGDKYYVNNRGKSVAFVVVVL